jgi:hypothetical protein
MNIHIVMTDDYSPSPAAAFIDRAEAEAVAASVYDVSQDRAASLVCEVPLLAFARMPAGAAGGGCRCRSAADAATD